MADELDDLKAAFDAATPMPGPLKKRDNIALAEKNFADLQGSRSGARLTTKRGPMARLGQGVMTMFQTMTTKGALTASTALVAVAVLIMLPEDALKMPGGDVDLSQPELKVTPKPSVAEDERAEVDTAVTRSDDLDGARETRGRDNLVAAPVELQDEGAAASIGATRQSTEAESFAAGDAIAMEEPMMEAAPTLSQLVAPSDRAMIAPASPPTAKRLIVEQDRIAPLPESNTETFANEETSPLKVTADDPVSTFSIDVDTASYAVVRSSIMGGQLPPRDAVRIEEMLNYFPYAYPTPEGPHPFEPTITVTPTPWNQGTNLVHIGIQGTLPAVEDRPPLNLVFLIDTSGSMQDANKLPLLKQSFRLMLSELRPEDEVSIVTYAGSAGQVLEPTPAGERTTILAALDQLHAGGSTAGQAGLQQAYQVAEGMSDDGEVTRVILATDGDFNVGLHDPEALKDFIADKRESGTYLSVLGFGRGNLDDATMQALAQNGNGQASYIDTLSEARKVLVDQLTGALFPIANDVKIQVEFNPERIAEYRLIGYETRALNREDFNNDRVDAGDIGAGHTVTALYEVTPVGSSAIRTGPLRYGQHDDAETTVSRSDELGYFKLRYKHPGEPTSVLIEEPIYPEVSEGSDDVQFSIAMAGFGQLLRDGDYLGAWNWESAIALASTARGDDPFGYRAEAVNLMRLGQALDR